MDNRRKIDSQASFRLQLEETQADMDVVPSSQGSESQDLQQHFSVGTALGLLSGSKDVDSPSDIFEERSGDMVTSQESQADQFGECSQIPLLASAPTLTKGGLKWSEKIKNAGIIPNFNSSTSSEMDNLVQIKSSLDDSVIEIIEDSPEKKDISIIDLGDSLSNSKEELKLVLDSTQSPQSKPSTTNISEMSEILAPNSLLCIEEGDIENIIENDEDVQSMLAHPASDLMDLDDSKEDMGDFMLQKSEYLFSPKKSKKEAWSPKKEIWSAKTTKRKASLTLGDESSKKRQDMKDKSLDLPTNSCSSVVVQEKSSDANHADDETTRSQHKEETESGPDSRPSSSQAIQSPDISCSPIIALENQGREGSHDPTARRTSTPGHRNRVPVLGLSSPQKTLRKKHQEEISYQNSSEDEVNVRPEKKSKLKSKSIAEEDTTFKEPTSLNTSSDQFLRIPGKTWINPKFQEELERLKCEWNVDIVDAPAAPKKRLSDVSAISSGGSSGYLGGSSSGITSNSGSGGSNKRSRLSIDPETRIERHQELAKLPKRNYQKACSIVDSEVRDVANPENDEAVKEVSADEAEKVTDAASVEAVAGSQASPKETPHMPTVEFANDENVEPIQTQREITDIPEEQEEDPTLKLSTPRINRKRKVSSDIKEPTPRKRLTKKRTAKKDSLDSTEEKVEVADKSKSEDISIDDRYVVGSKVFARWRDGTGVYFYAAVIKAVVSDEEVTVMFLDDKIERDVKKENEVISVSQLHPGHNVTVKHDIYNAYEVTASLMKFPVKRGNDFEYEVSIAATESEPQNNEDSRTVTHQEISLTDSQACDVLRNMGLIPTSNKVSAEINFDNLMFGGRRKGRGGSTNTTPSKPEIIKTPRRKRGGENVEDSAPTNYESSAAELSPRKGRVKVVDTASKKTPRPATTPRRQKNRAESTDDESTEEVMPKTSRRMQTVAKERSKLIKSPVPKRRSSKTKDIFAGHSFIFTQAKEQLPMTEPDDESYSDSEPNHSTKPLDIKFDKRSLRNVITAHGGTILTDFPTHNDPVSTLDTTLLTVCDHRCITMNYLLSLAHSVPVVSHVYILDCVSSSSLLDRGAYLLPAGFSTLLMQEVEQGKDCNQELRINDCLLPSPPATSTRQSNR